MVLLKTYLKNGVSEVRRYDEVRTANEFSGNLAGQFPRNLSFRDSYNTLQTINRDTLIILNKRESTSINAVIPNYVEKIFPRKSASAVAEITPDQKLVIQRAKSTAQMRQSFNSQWFTRLNEPGQFFINL